MFSFLQRSFTDSRWAWFLNGLPNFSRAVAMFKSKRYTMTTPVRCRHLWDSCSEALAQNVPGCFVECGVWKGGSSSIMALAIKNSQQERQLHLFDSFEGLPEPKEIDGEYAVIYSGGRNSGELRTINQCRADIGGVRDLLIKKLKIPERLIHFHVGWFQDTIPIEAQNLGSIAVLRLDGDWYDSTKVCLDHLYPLLSPGGVLILDDYYCWEGCRKASDEYRLKHNITSRIQKIDADAGYWITE